MRFVAAVLLATTLFACSPPSTQQLCSPTNCSGCCDERGTCQGGGANNACGTGGFVCAQCAGDEMCNFGRCASVIASGGGAGGGSGGGSGGGAGGGTGGGTGQDGGMDAGIVDAGVDAGVIDPCAGTLTSCGGRCVDTQADPENCAHCGNLCGSGQVCNRGRCEVLPNDCTVAGASCGPGYFCDPVSKRCMTGCRLTGDCPMGATCAGGTCSCPTDQHACGQQCVSNTSTDSCGTSCSACVIPANAIPVCMTGACDFTCNMGFTRQGNDCVDIDECTTSNGGCSTNATCTNTQGGRTCACNAGFSGDGVACNDIDECQTNNGGCATNATCTNTPGTRTCTCNTGFMGDGMSCADVDECATNNGGCAAVGGTCTNTVGSRTCACASGFTGNGMTCTDLNECMTNNGGCAAVGGACTNTPGSRTCACTSGFTGDGVTCNDVNECMTNNGGCAAVGGACTNTPGARTCACMSGFTGNGVTCTDVNECLTSNGGCATVAAGGVCTNTPGSRTCACNTGFTGDGFTCTDVNECMTNNGGCAAVAAGGVCTNTSGSRTCTCATGFTGNGFTCTDVNECLTNNGGCAAVAAGGVCMNTPGSRSCSCATGFSGNGFTCTDDNECLTNNGGCAAVAAGGVCTNTPGSRTCTCASGFTGNGLTCTDIDECMSGNGGCSANATCTNTTGSRTCTCNSGYSGNGVTCIPSGDTCAAAVVLTASTTVNGSTAGAVNDYSGPLSAACGGDSVPGREVVYSFTPAATGTFNVTANGTGFTPRFYVTPTCGTLSSCTWADARNNVNNFNFRGTAGVPTYITVDASSATAAGSFSLQVAPITPPANDTCATAIPLSVGTPVSGTFTGAVLDVPPSGSCTLRRLNGDVIYSFTPSVTGSYTFRETTGSDVVMSVAAACDGTCISVIDEPETVVTTLNAGTTYYLMLQPWTSATTFTVRVDYVPPPSNETCASPTVLMPSTTVNGSTAAAVNDYSGPLSAACGNTSVPGRDVVYSFTPSVTGNFNVSGSSADFSPSVYVTSTCGVTSSCISSDPGVSTSFNFNFHGTAGNQVFLTVDGYPFGGAGDFSIAVAPTITPPNDTCATATPLTVNTPMNGSFAGAVLDLRAVSGCGTSRNTSDVVYSFTPATTGLYAFSETTGADVVMWVGTACDGTCMGLIDEPEQLVFTLTGGTTYYFVLQPWQPTATNFTVQVTSATPPSNDTCSAPIALSPSTTVNGSTLAASNDYSGPLSGICGGDSVPGGEVVYSFTPPSTGNFNVAVAGNNFTPRTYVTSTCGTGSSCISADTRVSSVPSFNFHGTAGTPVFVTVDSSSSTGGGDFTVSVGSIPAPANDTCAAAQPLTLGVSRSGTTVGGVVDVRPQGGGCGQGRNTGEVVYSFTPSASGSYVFRETTSADVIMWVAGGSCGGTCLAYIDDPEQLTVNLTAGTTYFLMVEPYNTAGTIAVSVDTN